MAALAAEEHGVLALQELRACGLSQAQIKRRARKGHLHRRHEGVYAVGHPRLTREGRFLAAVKACGPDAWLSHGSATANFGLLRWEEGTIHVTVPGGTTRRHPGIRVHRTTTLDPRDTTRHNGIPTTAPARTLLDLAGSSLPDKGLRRATREAQAQRLVSVPALAKLLASHPRRRGTTRLAALLATGPAPTRSELEDVVLDVILQGGFAHPDVNRPLTLDGRRVVPDFRWPGQRLVLEADGARWHDTPLARADGAERQALLEAHGERVLRTRWEEAVTAPARVCARLRAGGAPHRR